jgi:hypothetical protein
LSSLADFRDLAVLNAFLRDAAESIGPALLPHQDWAPMAFLVNDARGLNVIPGAWNDDEGQLAFHEQLAQEVLRGRAVALGLVSPIWMLKTEIAGRALAKEPRPRDHPLREEALQVLTLSADKNLVAYATVTRTETAPPKLAEWQLEEGELEGVMATLVKEALRKVKDV